MAKYADPDRRVAIVTGAAGGLGGAIARAIAGDGAMVIGLDISSDGLRDRELEIGERFIGVPADVADEAACRQAADLVLARFRRIDILVNCAGITGALGAASAFPSFWERDMAEWRRVQAINHAGAFHMAALVAPSMLARGWGRIVNISTSLATMLAPGLAAYGPAKAAMEASAAIWAKELEGTGVTVNVLLPGGPVATASVPSDIPRERLLDAAIMGPPALWLASEAAAGTNGMRLIARDWDNALPPAEAASLCSAPAGWPAG
jgi:NAD(P)-dependent dehydrogenase (short-subunit alcohol dehydrogenase family)